MIIHLPYLSEMPWTDSTSLPQKRHWSEADHSGTDICMFLADPVQNIPDQLQEHFLLILGMQLKPSHASCIS